MIGVQKYFVLRWMDLVDEAPFENLKLGSTFKLYEGAKLVAEGKVIMDK